MATRASEQSKRTPNVLKLRRGSAVETGLKSWEDDIDEACITKKVRKELSVYELIRESEHFEPDGDHLYTKSKDAKAMDLGNKIPPVRLSRSSAGSYLISKSDKDGKNGRNMPVKRQKCFSKNAVLARLNREKKKQYISSLENANENLQKQNSRILQKVDSQEKVIKALKYEVLYLKSLLANSKEISEILKSIGHSTGLPVTSSLRSFTSDGEAETTGVHGSTPVKDIFIMQPEVKRAPPGSNFPILKDVNLGYFSSDDDDLLSYGSEKHSFSESCLDIHDSFLIDTDFDLNKSMFESSFDPIFNNELNMKEEEPVKSKVFPEVKCDVGLCLHVNKKKISVELCAICNSRAQM